MSESAAFVFRFEFDLADRLRKSLRVSGVSVGSMARSLGVSRNTVSNWINGRGEPRIEQLTIWAAITDAPLSWLETGVPPSLGENDDGMTRPLVMAVA
jgi:transcriptional regulator with XRE-family HTH domain